MSQAVIVVEGWRFLPHSYALVSQALCLEFLTLGVRLFHRDIEPFHPDWLPARGIMAPEDETRIAGIPAPPDGLIADAVFRCAFPYNLRRAPEGRTYVQVTAELGTMPDQCMVAFRPLREVHTQNDSIIITPSEYCRDGLLKAGADPARIAVVPHGVDSNVFAPTAADERQAIRRRFGWQDRFVFMNVGAMTENKGLHVLLTAFAAVAAKNPRVMLLLKGVDNLYQSGSNVATMLDRLNIRDPSICLRIVYSGANMNARELAQLYRAADAYISPYLAEGFNMPVLEAAACGLPIICTAGGPTDEFTTDAFARPIRSSLGPSPWGVGLSLKPDLQHTVELMSEMADDERFRTQAKDAGPAHVRSRFTWQHVAERRLTVLVPA